MYQPKPRPSSLPKEQETRSMVQFFTNLTEISDGLKALELARIEAEQAEEMAKEAHKQADFKIAEVNKKQEELNVLIDKFNALKTEVDAILIVNKKMEEEFKAKEVAIERWNKEALVKEQEYHTLFNSAISKQLELNKREQDLVEAEKKLAKKLAVLNG